LLFFFLQEESFEGSPYYFSVSTAAFRLSLYEHWFSFSTGKEVQEVLPSFFFLAFMSSPFNFLLSPFATKKHFLRVSPSFRSFSLPAQGSLSSFTHQLSRLFFRECRHKIPGFPPIDLFSSPYYRVFDYVWFFCWVLFRPFWSTLWFIDLYVASSRILPFHFQARDQCWTVDLPPLPPQDHLPYTCRQCTFRPRCFPPTVTWSESGVFLFFQVSMTPITFFFETRLGRPSLRVLLYVLRTICHPLGGLAFFLEFRSLRLLS